MPFHLGDDPAGLAPASGLIAEVGIMALDCIRWTSRPARKKMSNTAFQYLVASQSDGIAKFIGFQIIKQVRNGEGSIGTQIFAPHARPPVALDDGVKYGLPIIGAVNIAGAKRAPLKVAVLVEDKQRMITGAAEMPVPGRAFLRSVHRAYGTIDIQD